jgi:molecular chaperone DnaK
MAPVARHLTCVPAADDAAAAADGAPADGAARAATDAHAVRRTTGLSLGLRTLGGVMSPVIERNTPFPVRRTVAFAPTRDDDSPVSIVVLEGERPRASEDRALATLVLERAPRRDGRATVIEVTFDVDAAGRLDVTCRDGASGLERRLPRRVGIAVDRVDITGRIADARRHQDEDDDLRHLIAARNRIDVLARALLRDLDELRERIPHSGRCPQLTLVPPERA